MDNIPPPAPEIAWAMLSDCCAAVEDAIMPVVLCHKNIMCVFVEKLEKKDRN